MIKELIEIIKPFTFKLRTDGNKVILVPKNYDNLMAKFKELGINLKGKDSEILINYKDEPILISIRSDKDFGATLLWKKDSYFSDIRLRGKALDLGYKINKLGMFKDEKKVSSDYEEMKKILGISESRSKLFINLTNHIKV